MAPRRCLPLLAFPVRQMCCLLLLRHAGAALSFSDGPHAIRDVVHTNYGVGQYGIGRYGGAFDSEGHRIRLSRGDRSRRICPSVIHTPIITTFAASPRNPGVFRVDNPSAIFPPETVSDRSIFPAQTSFTFGFRRSRIASSSCTYRACLGLIKVLDVPEVRRGAARIFGRCAAI